MQIDIKTYREFITKFDFSYYLQMLLNNLENNAQSMYLVNKIFFPEQYNIQQWVQSVGKEDLFLNFY